MSEVLSYCVDVLAASPEEAQEIALETEMKGEPDSESFDVDSIEALLADDRSFCPINESPKCHGRMEDFEPELVCSACKPKPVSSIREASQLLYNAIQEYLDVSDADLIEQGHKGLVEAMDEMEAAWRKADGTLLEQEHEQAA